MISWAEFMRGLLGTLFILMLIAYAEAGLFHTFHDMLGVDLQSECNCPNTDFAVMNFQGILDSPACAVPHKWACSEVASFSIAFHEMLHKQFGMPELQTILMGNVEAVLLWAITGLLSLRILGATQGSG